MSATDSVDSFDIVDIGVAHGGLNRRASLTVPRDGARGAPVVLVLHGSNHTGARMRVSCGGAFDALAARERLVVAYPDAHRGLWVDARASFTHAAKERGVDDVAFLVQLVDHLADTAQLGTDPRRVYVVGHSNGGHMALRMLLAVPTRIAGVAMIGATMPVPENLALPVPRDAESARPVLLIHGTRDRIAPYVGGMTSLWGFRPRGLGLSAPESARFFAEKNGITTAPVTTTIDEGSAGALRVTRTDHRAPGKARVALVTIEGGGHTIPNRTTRAPFVFGRTAHNVDAAELAWDVFTTP